MKDSQRYQELLVGPIRRFDRSKMMFSRAFQDPDWIERGKLFFDAPRPRSKAGYSFVDYALRNSAWMFEHFYLREMPEGAGFLLPERLEETAYSPADHSRIVKRAAALLGASLVGICALDERWLFEVDPAEELPRELRNVVVIAIEMDHFGMEHSPTGIAEAVAGFGYSQMAVVSSMVAQFIRDLGYQAIPTGNKTALTVPMAVEAGLGEMGRHGILITERYGPRVRLCTVFTDMPLLADQPRFFGVTEFCQVCKKCAEHCPSQAISYGERTTEGETISTNPGVLKWYINPEQCFRFWAASQMGCSDCVRICPYTQKDGWHHDLVRAISKRTTAFNRLFLWAHGLLRYGKQRDAESFWQELPKS